LAIAARMQRLSPPRPYRIRPPSVTLLNRFALWSASDRNAGDRARSGAQLMDESAAAVKLH
jgi:hypothetical protein